eukprot:4293390-Amphidinium_carterae.1
MHSLVRRCAPGSPCPHRELDRDYERLAQFCRSGRMKVRHVAVDDTLPRVYQSLKQVLPNMKLLSLDPLHLVFVYEQKQWKKITSGGCFLRSVHLPNTHIISSAVFGRGDVEDCIVPNLALCRQIPLMH